MQVDEAPVVHCPIRVVSIYATRWRYGRKPTRELRELHRKKPTEELKLNLKLGRLAEFYDFYKDQLPRGLTTDELKVEDVAFDTEVPRVRLTSAETTLFALPSNQVVVTLTLGFETTRPADDPGPTAQVLERCIHGALSIGGRTLPEYVRGLAVSKGAEPIDDEKADLLPERHQLVFVPRLSQDEDPPDADTIREIVYLDDPPYREEFTSMQEPEQLNLKTPQRTLGVVTPYVSLIYGHEQFVEDSIFLSTVHAVGTASRFRQIPANAHRELPFCPLRRDGPA